MCRKSSGTITNISEFMADDTNSLFKCTMPGKPCEGVQPVVALTIRKVTLDNFFLMPLYYSIRHQEVSLPMHVSTGEYMKEKHKYLLIGISVHTGILAGFFDVGQSDKCPDANYPYRDGSGRCTVKDDITCCSKP